MVARLRVRLYQIMEKGTEEDRASRIFDGVIMALIAANVVMVILETVPSLYHRYEAAFRWFEVFSVAIFTAEYVLRLWTCTAELRFHHPVGGRLRFMLTPLALIDLLAGYDKAVIIDAVFTKKSKPGTIRKMSLSDFKTVGFPSPHFTGLPELKEVAGQLDLKFPDEIDVFAVEGEECSVFGQKLSGAVLNAVDDLIDRVRKQIFYWQNEMPVN